MILRTGRGPGACVPFDAIHALCTERERRRAARPAAHGAVLHDAGMVLLRARRLARRKAGAAAGVVPAGAETARELGALGVAGAAVRLLAATRLDAGGAFAFVAEARASRSPAIAVRGAAGAVVVDAGKLPATERDEHNRDQHAFSATQARDLVRSRTIPQVPLEAFHFLDPDNNVIEARYYGQRLRASERLADATNSCFRALKHELGVQRQHPVPKPRQHAVPAGVRMRCREWCPPAESGKRKAESGKRKAESEGPMSTIDWIPRRWLS